MRWLSFGAILLLAVFLITLFLHYLPDSPEPIYEDDIDPTISRLRSLGYLDYVEDESFPQSNGVTLNDIDKAFDGLNLYVPFGTKNAYLMTNEGLIIHNWSYVGDHTGQYAILYPDGNLLFMVESYSISKLDYYSNILWENQNRQHHDMQVLEDGNILSLMGKRRYIEFEGEKLPIRDDLIITMSPEGEILSNFSIYDAFKKRNPEEIDELNIWLKNKELKDYELENGVDLFHINTAESIKRDIGVGDKGDIIICSFYKNFLAILSKEDHSIKWFFSPSYFDIIRAHGPTVLDNGNILLLDNGGGKNSSRVIEFDPRTKELIWEYRADPPEDFRTVTMGNAQVLPNDNVLITEAKKGRVFEVTRAGEKVWEFFIDEYNEAGLRRPIYRMKRLSREDLKKIRFDEKLRKKLEIEGYL